MKEQLERDIELLDEASECVKAVSSFHDREDLKKFVSILQCIIYEITPRDTKEQREFKNKDFHVKVWQDSEKIGIETVWIREGFKYQERIDITRNAETTMYDMVYPVFGGRRLKDEILLSDCGYSYSDIVTELEKAHKLSSEVTIYDVIKECDWVRLEVRVHYLDQPRDCIMRGYQLRLKN